HLASIKVGRGLLLEPLAVGDEVLERHRLWKLPAVRLTPALERELSPRRGDARRAKRRAQEHPLRHLIAPELHRVTADEGWYSKVPQIRGDGQTQRPGAHYRHPVVRCHRH